MSHARNIVRAIQHQTGSRIGTGVVGKGGRNKRIRDMMATRAKSIRRKTRTRGYWGKGDPHGGVSSH